ncbi:MAG TPA: hypothetical protein V6D14_19760 [Coleofasciculaceae cyanobacterium]
MLISLVSVQVPAQQDLVSFIREQLIGLGAESIKTAKIYEWQVGQDLPA